MSNGRKFRRGLGAATLGTATLAGGFALVGGAASAQSASPTVTSSNPTVHTGSSAQLSFTFTVNGPVTSGSVLRIDLPANSDPLTAITFSGNGIATGLPAGTTVAPAPAATVTLATDPADPQPPAVPNKYTGTDEADITFNSTDATATDSFTYTVSGLSINAPKAAALGPVAASDTYVDAGTNTAYPAAKFTAADVISLPVAAGGVTSQGVTIVQGQPAVASGQAPSGTDSVTALPTATFTAPEIGAFGEAGNTSVFEYSLGNTDVNFVGTPMVTTNYGTVALVPPAQPSGSYNSLTFTYTPPTTAPTTPLVITISGLSAVSTNGNPGYQVTATLTNSTSNTVSGVAQYGTTVELLAPIAGTDANTTAADIFNDGIANNGPRNTNVSTITGTAVLATNITYADALSGTSLAGLLHTGILLTDQGDLPQVTRDAIVTNGITKVVALGGPDVISPAVINAIGALVVNGTTVQVTQLYGRTAYDTNQAVSQYELQNGGTATSTNAFSAAYGTESTYNDTTGAESSTAPSAVVPTAIVASGDEFQDALAAGPLASRQGLPVILTDASLLSSQASAELVSEGIKQVILLGGPLAVTNGVESSIASANGGISVLRVAGQDGTDTAQLLSQFEQKYFGFVSGPVDVARGDGYTDALAAGPYLGIGDYYGAGAKTNRSAAGEPLLLTQSETSVGQYLTSYLSKEGVPGTPASYEVQQFGGPLALTPALIKQAEDDLAATPGSAS